MNARQFPKSSDVAGTGLGDQSPREWHSPEDMDCSANMTSLVVFLVAY